MNSMIVIVFLAFGNVVPAGLLPIAYSLAVDKATKHNWQYVDQNKRAKTLYWASLLSGVLFVMSLVALAIKTEPRTETLVVIVLGVVYWMFLKQLVIEKTPPLSFAAAMERLVNQIKIPAGVQFPSMSIKAGAICQPQ